MYSDTAVTGTLQAGVSQNESKHYLYLQHKKTVHLHAKPNNAVIDCMTPPPVL